MATETQTPKERLQSLEQIKLRKYDGVVGRILSGNLDLRTPLTLDQTLNIKNALLPENDIPDSVKDKIEQAQREEREKYYENKTGDHLDAFAKSISDWVRGKKPVDANGLAEFTKALQAIHIDVDLLTDTTREGEGLEKIKKTFYARYFSQANEVNGKRQTDIFISDVLGSCNSMNDFLTWMHHSDQIMSIFTETAGNGVRAELYAQAQKRFSPLEIAQRLNTNSARVNNPEPHEQITLNGIEHGQWVATDALQDTATRTHEPVSQDNPTTARAEPPPAEVTKSQIDIQAEPIMQEVEKVKMEIKRISRSPNNGQGQPMPEPVRTQLFDRLSEANRNAAKLFCETLRNRLKREQRSGNVFTDPQSGISINANTPEAIDHAWFDANGFTEWAETNNLPIVYWMEPDNHARLLLKGPYKGSDGCYKVLVYDPLRQDQEEYEETLTMREGFDSYRRREITRFTRNSDGTYTEKQQPRNQQGFKSKNTIIQDIDVYLYYHWFKSGLVGLSPEKDIPGTAQGRAALAKGDYDLSLGNDPQLPQHMIAAKNQQFQWNGYDCVPLTLFSGALRYTAKHNKNEVQHLVRKLRSDFNINLLARDELLGKV